MLHIRGCLSHNVYIVHAPPFTSPAKYRKPRGIWTIFSSAQKMYTPLTFIGDWIYYSIKNKQYNKDNNVWTDWKTINCEKEIVRGNNTIVMGKQLIDGRSPIRLVMFLTCVPFLRFKANGRVQGWQTKGRNHLFPGLYSPPKKEGYLLGVQLLFNVVSQGWNEIGNYGGGIPTTLMTRLECLLLNNF